MIGTRKKLIRTVVVLALLSAGGIVAYWRWIDARVVANTGLFASGTVEATEGQFGFQVAGRLETVSVHEGDRIRGGTELARLDRSETESRRAQALAQVAVARAQLLELERGFRSEEIAQARAAVGAGEQKLHDAQRDRDRTRRLFDGGAVSQEALDKATTAAEIAASQKRQVDEQLRLLEAGPRAEKIAAQRAQVAQAEAAVRALDVVLGNQIVVAPFDGVITVRHREPGETVPPGAAVITVMNPADRWVRIYVSERRIGEVRIGMRAAIRCDTFPDRSYRGEVVFVAPEAEFTPKSVQTAEERVKLVYAVKVRILDDPQADLKPGMPADVTLEADEE